MSNIGQNKNENLLRGLSSFWTRFFKDKEFLETLYSATDLLMGKVYLELLESLLTNSAEAVPVFSKDFWKLLTFTSTDAVIVGTTYRFTLPTDVIRVRFIYNKIFEPTAILEENQDFTISGNYIYFSKNIFDDLACPGFAKRRQSGATVISMWTPEAEVDKEYVYEYYGTMLKIYEPSSESYKSFIRGIWFYYMNGPTVNRITSAMNIIGGYPVATEDGEIVLSITEINSIYYVKTTITTYSIGNSVDLAVTVGQTLRAFQHLTTAYLVTDYIDDPTWFDHIVVPIEVLPNLTVAERTTERYNQDVITIGYPILIGTPGWIIGEGNQPNYMWLFFNQVLKYNIFYITYNALASKFIRSTADLTDIVVSGKPAFDLALVVPYLGMTDTVTLPAETLTRELEYTMSDTLLYSWMTEALGFEADRTLTDTNLIPVEQVSYELEYLMSDAVTLSTEVNSIELEFLLSDTVPYAWLSESLTVQNQTSLDDESYGQTPVSFGDSPTLIGNGLIGGESLRVGSGVPVWIGINTLGYSDAGMYTEYPVEIFIT